MKKTYGSYIVKSVDERQARPPVNVALEPVEERSETAAG